MYLVALLLIIIYAAIRYCGVTILATSTSDFNERVEMELRECPFCGGKPEVVGCKEDRFFVSCTMCYCCLGEGCTNIGSPDNIYPTREEAVSEWNRRPDPWISIAEHGKPKQGGVYLAYDDKEEDIALCGYWPHLTPEWASIETDRKFNVTHYALVPGKPTPKLPKGVER